MNIVSVITLLNSLKTKKKLKDYAIFGAIGALRYMEPIYTNDIDVLVLVSSDSEYISLWRELADHAQKTKEFGFIIDQTELQIFPTSIDPLYESALKNAKRVKVEGVITKVVDREHLLLLFLKANRQKDRFRAFILIQNADRVYLGKLITRFDKDGILKQRLASLH